MDITGFIGVFVGEVLSKDFNEIYKSFCLELNAYGALELTGGDENATFTYTEMGEPICVSLQARMTDGGDALCIIITSFDSGEESPYLGDAIDKILMSAYKFNLAVGGA
ncbi:hypothetical protein VCHA53O466_50160 [Vibrio chagasii]|nr:hypothetical protein VCHA53O466_50160 [Vibrio chagasii]